LSSSFLKCFAHQSEEAWQREKVHGTEENLEWGIGEKNEEQIDAESGFEEEDRTTKEEADGEDEDLSSGSDGTGDSPQHRECKAILCSR